MVVAEELSVREVSESQGKDSIEKGSGMEKRRWMTHLAGGSTEVASSEGVLDEVELFRY